MAGAKQFVAQLNAFVKKTENVTQETFGRAVSLAHDSITIGSAITAAPGQPVKTGALMRSFQVRFNGRWSALIGSDLVYAPFIEHGIGAYGPLTLRSKVGGFHSIKRTRAGWPRIVNFALSEAKSRYGR